MALRRPIPHMNRIDVNNTFLAFALDHNSAPGRARQWVQSCCWVTVRRKSGLLQPGEESSSPLNINLYVSSKVSSMSLAFCQYLTSINIHCIISQLVRRRPIQTTCASNQHYRQHLPLSSSWRNKNAANCSGNSHDWPAFRTTPRRWSIERQC